MREIATISCKRLGGLLGVVAVAMVMAAAGCGGGGGTPTSVVLVTHDSFAISPDVKKAFESETGLKLRILQGGDAGEVVTKALLTAGKPEGDVLFGIDSNLLSRALDGDVFEPYASSGLAAVDPAYVLDPDHRVTPVDHGEVCLNVDKTWYEERSLVPPGSSDDLIAERYRGQLVVENPATSTPGLAFLLATVAKYGDPGWQDYWRKLRTNDVLVVDGWEEAYTVRFSGASGSRGNRPIVVSYASSPPAEVIFRKPRPKVAPTGVVLDSCYRQIEFAGVLRGARNEDGARKLIDFMLSKRFQEDVPLSMFVFPVNETASIPAEFAPYTGGSPLALDPEVVERDRERWVDEWTQIVLR